MDLLHAVDGDLLESPVWDARDQSLLFVDMRRPALHRFDWAEAELSTFGRGTEASAIQPATLSELLVAERDAVTLGVSVPPVVAGRARLDRSDVRFNDAACDAAGRLWIGTMADDASPGAGCLFRLDPDLSWALVLEGVTISNGIGWSPDNDRMYYIDSVTLRIDVFDFDLGSGQVHHRRQLVDTSDFSGLPDGLTVDADGCLWVAFYRGGAIRKFAPDGRLLEAVTLPVLRPTSLCFAGPGLDVLVVTVRGDETGSEGRPAGAHLYAHDCGSIGMPTAPFGG